MANFKYEPLPSNDTYIRLVELPVGEKTGEVNCTIAQYPFNQIPEYEVLSYCWGDPEDQAYIKCNEQLLLIPKNAEKFLLRTRAKGKKRILWIDSICINQKDDLEKASQVRLMRDIFAKAMRTLIWLGEEEDDSTLALDFAVELYRAYNKLDSPKKPSWISWMRRDEFHGIKKEKWRAFFKLLNRPWFQRAWVVQEVVVAQEPWIICGDKSALWLVLVVGILQIYTNLTWAFEFYGSHNINTVLVMHISRDEYSKKKRIPFYEILCRHRQARAKDPRDNIYGFLGITSLDESTKKVIQPDYNIPPEDLYLNFAVSILAKATNLDFLGIPRLTTDESIPNLPSWAPDWSASEPFRASLLQLETSSMAERIEKAYNATKGSTYTLEIDLQTKRLKLSGYIVDKILETTEPWVVQNPSGDDTLHERATILQNNQRQIHSVENFVGIRKSTKYRYTGESMEDVVWQTCVAGVFPQGVDDMRDAYKQFSKRQRYLRIFSMLHLDVFLLSYKIFVIVGHILYFILGLENPEMKFRSRVSAMVNRSFAKSVDAGYIGLVPGITQKGDYIALFEGGKIPFIIRARGPPEDNNWELIGDCYIHGMMQGRTWEEKKENNEECKTIWLS